MAHEELPDAELDVLAALWHHGESTARDVREALDPHRPMTHGAVFALLSRLEAKGLVTRGSKKIGKAFLYRARIRPAATYRRKVKELVERLFGGSSVDLVSSLFETRPPSDDELEQLQELLDDLRRGRRRDSR